MTTGKYLSVNFSGLISLLLAACGSTTIDGPAQIIEQPRESVTSLTGDGTDSENRNQPQRPLNIDDNSAGPSDTSEKAFIGDQKIQLNSSCEGNRIEERERHNIQTNVTNSGHDDKFCRGYLKRIETSERSIRAIFCDNSTKKFAFKNLIVDVKPNFKYPYVAVYTSSFHKHRPLADAGDVFPDELSIVNLRASRTYRYNANESTEYYYNLWSQEGDYVALLGDGINIIKSTRLDSYLKRRTGAYRVVDTNKGRSPDSHFPAEILGVVGWRSNTVLIFTNGCCGYIWRTEYDLSTDTYKRLECAEGYCMKVESDHLVTNQKDIVISGGTLSKYDVYGRLKKYFGGIEERCLSTKKTKSVGVFEGRFLLTFDVLADGSARNPKISKLEASKQLPNKVDFLNCLIPLSNEVSFSALDTTEPSNVTISIKIRSGD